jgi:hypothetical protein
MSILSLSLELVENIYRYLDPASHLNFALINKHTFHFSSGILNRHRDCHRSYRNFTEQNPESLVELLENVVKDHVVAWHVRTFQELNSRTWHTDTIIDEAKYTALAKRFYAAMAVNGFPAFRLDRLQLDGLLFIETIQTAILALSTGLHTLKSTAFVPDLGHVANESVTDNLWINDQLPS